MPDSVKKGYYFNQDDCIGCKACQIACKDKNDFEVGTLFRHVMSYTVGTYPDVRMYHYSATCNHCQKPECVAVCPNSAMYIDDEDGTVQHDDTNCIGCGYCVEACPYGVPQVIDNLSRKCDACKPLREAGEQPACVAACPVRALDFGSFEELAAAHPDAVDKIAILPDPTTGPCTLINAKEAALDEGFQEIVL